MTLIISVIQRFDPLPRPSRTRPARHTRIEELLDVMLPWDRGDRSHAFKVWLHGSLSLVHLQVLATIESGGPLPMSRLADALDVSVANATGIVTRMEERGLVERRHSDTDRRVVNVHVTQAGTDVFTKLDHDRRAHMSTVLERLTDDELDSLLVGLRATRRARAEIGAERAAAEAADAAKATVVRKGGDA